MKKLGGAMRRGRVGLALLVALLTVCLLLPGPMPASAEQGTATLAAALGFLSFLGAGAIGYGVWELSRPNQPRVLNGEFYVAGYLGASFAQSQDLRYSDGASFNNGVVIQRQGKFTVFGNTFDPGIVGGVKLGYFFHGVPYLGLEGETSFSPNPVSNQTRNVSPSVLGSNQVTMPSKSWLNWTTAFHIVGRYGFLKDKEVPFGRLQPYVGIGPAVVAMYDPEDSAKNFAIDVMGGVRYMIQKNLSAFVEYKYNHQFDAEMEIHQVNVNGFVGHGTARLDYDLHRVVFGMAYHW